MIIVYNVGALITVLVSAALMALIYWIFPNWWFENDRGFVIFFSISTFVSGLFELMGLKPRIFWIPVIIWSAFLQSIMIYDAYGSTGLLIAFLVIAVFVAAVFYLVYKMDESGWKKAQETFATLLTMQADPSNTQIWQALEASLYRPIIKKTTPEMCGHNLKVATLIGSFVTDEENLVFVEDYKASMLAGSNSNGKIKLDKVAGEKLDKLIEAKKQHPDKIVMLDPA